MSTLRALASLGLLLLSADRVALASRGDQAIPILEVERSVLTMIGAVLHQGGRPFTGYAVERRDGGLLSRTPFLEGREDGLAEAWYPSGARRYEKLYRGGHREGTHHGWWQNGERQFLYRYASDLFEGEQVAFYADGTQSELRHYSRGREEGRQRFWNEDGRVIANYVMSNGRRYGIVGRRDCVPVVGE